MVLTPTVSLAAPERVTLQGASSVASFGPKEGLGRNTGIVEGWGGDEDEDVSIDSDEKDSGSEALLAAAESPQLQRVPTGGSSLQLPNSSGMRERTESSEGPASKEDLAGSHERAVTVNKADSPNVALKGNGSKVRAGKDQVGSFDGGTVENGNISTAPKGIRLGSSSEGSALEGGAKRLDARGFRREFNIKTDSIPPRIKTAVPDAGQMRESSISYAKEGKKLPEEKGGKANKSSPTQPHLRTAVKSEGGNVAGDSYGKGKRTFREISKERESVYRRSMTVHKALGGEHFNKDSSKKRRFNDLAYSQAAERKSSLRVRGELSKRSERRLGRESRSERRLLRESRGYGDAGPLPKIKRARKDEDVSEVGTSVPEKQTLPKRGLEKVGRSPALLLTQGGRQKSAVDKKSQRPLRAKGNFQSPSSEGEKSRRCLPGDGAQKADSGGASEAVELDNLVKVFERRPTKRKEKENGTGDTPESKRLTRQSTAARDLSDVSGGMVKTVGQKTGEKGKEDEKQNGKLVDRKPTRSTDRAQEAEKGQQSGGGSDESQNCISKQWQEGERGGFNLRRRPTRNAEKGKEGADNGHMLVRTKSATVQGTITAVEDTKNDLKNSGGDRHLISKEFSGVELKVAGVGEKEVLQAEKLNGKIRQSSEAEMESNRKLLHGGVITQVANLEVKEGSEAEMESNRKLLHGGGITQVANSEVKEGVEREDFDVEQLTKSKKQRLTDGKGKSTSSLQGNSASSPSLRQRDDIWHPKTPLSQSTKLTVPGLRGTQCVAMSIADVHPNREAAPVDLLPKGALREKQEDDNVLEEGEIENSDSDGEQEVAKVAELVLLGKTNGETRLGASENDLIHEDSKSGTRPTVRHNEPSLSKMKLRLGRYGAVLEKPASEVTTLSEGLCGTVRAVDTSDIDGQVSPHASTVVADGEKSEPVAVAGGDNSRTLRAFNESAKHENDCSERHSVQAENQIDEHGVRDDFPTESHESVGRDQVGELQSPSGDKLSRFETSELHVVDDSKGEDRSDSDDGRESDYHNSYCQHCRQGGDLLCCDGTGCKITYHLECAEPKLLEVPSGNWYCPTCAQKRLSYGVHAVSKSVESIWDVRNRVQNSDNSTLCRKDVPANGLHGVRDGDPRVGERSLEGAKGTDVKNRDKVEDGCIAALTVYIDDEEGIPGIDEATSGSQGAIQRTDEDVSVQKLTERRQWDADGKISEKSRMTVGKTIPGSTSSAIQGVKLVDESADKEYFVKWRGISHAHNTWVGEAELAKLSPKGLVRFKKKLAEGQAVQWNSDWAEPQRLVDKRTSIPPRRPGGGRGRGFLGMDAQQEWFVKWKGLGYEHCTWEPVHSGVLSDPKVKQLEMMFDRWSEAARQRNHPQRVDEVDKLREESFKQLRSQPEWIRFGKLLPYQLDRLNQLRQRWHHRKNTIIVDQDEQEKPLTTVTFLLSLIEEYGVYRLILVIVPVFEIQCWEAEITEHAPQVNTVVYTGGKEARGVIQRYELNRSNAPLRVQVVLTTCDVALSDFDYLRKIKWECVVIDESQQFKTAKSHRALLQFDAGFWLLFISELSKYNVDELQQLLFLFHPQSSSSTSDVRKQLSVLDESNQLQYLKDQLRAHTVRDSKPDDASGVKLVECWVGTNMTSLQVQQYCSTLTKHYNLLQSGRLRSDPDSVSLHDLVTQLRLCCQHPYHADPTLQRFSKGDVLAPEEVIDAGVAASEKFQLLDAMLSVLHGQHHRVVILSQVLAQLFFLDDYVRHKYGPDSYEFVDTRYSAQRKSSAVHRFNAKDSTRSFFLLRTGASGFSLKLKDNDIVIIHDSDLNPANDLEYLRKVLHRVGEVKVFRLYQRFTVEEGSMVYDQQKKLMPDPKPLSVKILQQLLRWKVQHILELDSSSLGKTTTPKGKQKVDVNDKAAEDLKRAAAILQGNFDMESATENYVDEVWTEEDGESVKEFWFSLLKDRHAELQDHQEQLNTGKGLRQRKRVQYSEEVLALRPYSAREEEEIRRKRKRPQLVELPSICVTQDKEIQSSLQSLPSTPRQDSSCQGEEAIQDNTLCSKSVPEVGGTARAEPDIGLTAPVHIAGEHGVEPVGSDGGVEQRTQEAEQKTQSKAITSSVGKKVKKEVPTRHARPEVVPVDQHQKPTAAGSVPVTTSYVDNGKRLRMEQKQLLLRMEPELSQVCNILQVEMLGPCHQVMNILWIAAWTVDTVHYLPEGKLSVVFEEVIVVVDPYCLSYKEKWLQCLIASTHFRQVVEHLPVVSLVGEKMNLALKSEDFASVYIRLEGMCKTCVAPPSVPQGTTVEETLLDEPAHVSISSQPASAGSQSPVQIPPICQESEPSPSTSSSLQPSGGKQACNVQNDSLQNRVVPVGKPEVALMAQDDLLSTELEQIQQPTSAGVEEVAGVQNADPTLHTHSDQEPATLLPGEIRARLKTQRDQLLHSWLAKQKLEVQAFVADSTRERIACRNSFEKQKDRIVAKGIKMELRVEMLAELGEVYASTLKLCERDEEERRQVMNSTQRIIRDRINALYAKLLQQATTGKLPDLLSEARSMGLTFVSLETPKSLEQGPTHTKDGHQIAVPQVRQSAQLSVPDQNTDLGSLPSALRPQIPPLPQHQTQPQSREAPTPHVPICQPMVQTQSIPQHGAHVLPEVQVQSQPRPRLQHLDIQQSSPVRTFSPPSSQAVLSNLDREPEQLVTAQAQSSYPPPQRSQSDSFQQNNTTIDRSQPSRSLSEPSHNGVASATIQDISSQGLERTHSGIEQGIVQSPRTEPARVPELINTSTTGEPMISHTSQALESRASQVVQIPMSLQPRVTQTLHTATSLPARISQSVQASPSLQPRASHALQASPSLQQQSLQASPSLQPQSSQAIDAPTSLQPRVPQIRRPVSSQYASRHSPSPSLYHVPAPQVRVQPQLQPTGGQGYSLPNTSSVGGTSLANQTRPTVHVQNVPLGAHSSQSAFGPDPLAHEEHRLKREQEKLKALYSDETTQIKAQYDREATELRKKFEGLLFERARLFDRKTTALKENLEKVDRNRQLAEALKLRSFLDHQKARHTPGHNNDVIALSAPVGRLSGASAQISGRGNLHHSQQTNVRNVGRNTGRGFAAGVANSSSGLITVADAGTPNSTSQGVNPGLPVPPWQNSRAIHGQNMSPAGLPSGPPVSSAPANGVPQAPGSFSSAGFVSVAESFSHTNPSLSNGSGPFPSSFPMVPLQPTSGSMQQGRVRAFLQDGSENLLVPSSSARVEHLSSHQTNSELLTAASAMSITTAVSSPTVTEAVVVSVSPVVSPVRDQLSNIEFAGNLFIQEQSHLESGPLSADELNDLMMPNPSENPVSSTFETRVRNGSLLEAEFEGLGAPTQIDKGLASSQPSTVGLSPNLQTPGVPVIYLSDDDD